MTHRARLAVGTLAILALVGPLVVDWLWVSDEERVVAAIDAIEAALEERDAESALAWFAEEIEVERPIQGVPRGPLAAAVRAVLARTALLAIDRDDTRIELAEPGRARVTATGHALLEIGGMRAPLRFEAEFELRDGEDRRFLLDRVVRLEVRPPFG